MRRELTLDLERMIWRRARTEVPEKMLAQLLSMYEVAGCSYSGDEPAPGLERSVFLWHSTLGDATLAARVVPLLVQRCPAEEDFFLAHQGAHLLVAENRGGILLRDVFFDRPDIRFRDDWSNRFTAFARDVDRFLLRLLVFRGVPLLDDLGVSTVVLPVREMSKIRELLQESGQTPSSPDWGWHITAMWMAVANDGVPKGSLAALPRSTPRH